MKRRRSNPLALAVLAQLCEGPMHPYEIATQMRSRGVETNIKLNYGSLYSVVD
ncbi:MAG: PadR family transcriptional regulator, partial [Chloroflexota bacterium]